MSQWYDWHRGRSGEPARDENRPELSETTSFLLLGLGTVVLGKNDVFFCEFCAKINKNNKIIRALRMITSSKSSTLYFYHRRLGLEISTILPGY